MLLRFFACFVLTLAALAQTTQSPDAQTLTNKRPCSASVTASCIPMVDAAGNQAVPNALITNAEYNNGTCTVAATISAAHGNRQKIVLTDAQTCALTFTQPASGTASIQLKVIQSSAGTFSGVISGGLWPSGTVPTITKATGAVDIISCYLDGVNAYCVATQDFK